MTIHFAKRSTPNWNNWRKCSKFLFWSGHTFKKRSLHCPTATGALYSFSHSRMLFSLFPSLSRNYDIGNGWSHDSGLGTEEDLVSFASMHFSLLLLSSLSLSNPLFRSKLHPYVSEGMNFCNRMGRSENIRRSINVNGVSQEGFVFGIKEPSVSNLMETWPTFSTLEIQLSPW